MSELNALLNVVVLILLGTGLHLINVFKKGTEAAAKASAEEGVKAYFEKHNWPDQLARLLEQTRGIERQELRYKSYGALWKRLRPLAIYDATRIDKKAIGDLSSELSDWYFSEIGGLLLTPQARSFYFALQDLLRATSGIDEEWSADRAEESAGDQDLTFRIVLEKLEPENTRDDMMEVLAYFSEANFSNWQNKAVELGKKWRDGVNVVAARWNDLELTDGERFAVLQQAGSKLRTSLTVDLDSRLR